MNTLKLNFTQTKLLLKKAYEWRGKINKRNNRTSFLKTQKAIKRFKRYIQNENRGMFRPNRYEIELTLTWFKRCPPINNKELDILTLIALVYQLHKFELKNIQKTFK